MQYILSLRFCLCDIGYTSIIVAFFLNPVNFAVWGLCLKEFEWKQFNAARSVTLCYLKAPFSPAKVTSYMK